MRRDTGRLNKAFTSNHIVSSKQQLNGLKTVNWLGGAMKKYVRLKCLLKNSR